MTMIETSDTAVIDAIRNKVNSAKREGIVVAAVMRQISLEDGKSSRKDIMEHVADAMGLDDTERYLYVDLGNHLRSAIFSTVVSYTMTDMKNGVYGPECKIINDNDANWSYTGKISEYETNRLMAERSNIKRKKGTKALEKECKRELANAFKTVPAIMRKGRDFVMKDLVAIMIDQNLSPEETLAQVEITPKKSKNRG